MARCELWSLVYFASWSAVACSRTHVEPRSVSLGNAPASAQLARENGVRTPAAPAPASLPVEFHELEPEAPSSSAPSVSFSAPHAEQVLGVNEAARARVVLNVEGGLSGAGTEQLLLELDGFRPRSFAANPAAFELGELMDEGYELTPGEHHVSVALLAGNGRIAKIAGGKATASIRFWIGSKPESSADPRPMVIYNLPRGTYNGPRASDALVVDFAVAGAELGERGASALVTITGAGLSAKRELTTWRALGVRGLPSGDFDVRVTLALHGVPQKVFTERTITINRDLPDVPP